MKILPLLYLILLLNTTYSFGQKRVDSLLKAFNGWYYDNQIASAKNELENYQEKIIPKIISLLYDERYKTIVSNPYIHFPSSSIVNVSNHDIFVPYNINWLSIKAGWLLEQLTFMNFGYQSEYNEKDNSSDYYAGKNHYLEHTIKWVNIPTKASLLKTRKPMADTVAAWWQKNKATWTRIGALKEALQSNDVKRQTMVLDYLLSGVATKCDELTKNIYKTEIEPLILALKNSDNISVASKANILASNYQKETKQLAPTN